MRSPLALPLFVYVAFIAACGGQIDGTTGSGHQSTPQPISHPTPGPTPTPTPTPTPDPGTTTPVTSSSDLCTSGPTPPNGNYPYFPTAEATLDAVIGVWQPCDASGEGPGGPAGFEVTPDGHFYKLGADASGHLIRLYGFQNEREFEAAPQGDGGFYPYFVTYDGGFYVTMATSAEGGNALDMMEYAQAAHRYVRSTTTPITAPPPPSGAQGAAGCGMAETNLVHVTTEAEARSAVLGTWVACPTGASSGGEPSAFESYDGIELDADGTWSLLHGGVHATEPYSHGTFSFYGNDGQPYVQLNLGTSENSTIIGGFALSTAPAKLLISPQGTSGAVYSKMP